MHQFKLVSPFKPMGDQIEAIDKLVAGVKAGKKEQVLLGGTGTGKTFTVSNVIAAVNLHGWISAYSANPERLFTRRESVIRQL